MKRYLDLTHKIEQLESAATRASDAFIRKAFIQKAEELRAKRTELLETKCAKIKHGMEAI